MPKPKPLFLIYAEHPMCSIDCADGVRDVLESSKEYSTLLVGPHSFPYMELTKELLADTTCLVIPGGLGDADQFDTSELKPHTALIRDYVAGGGRYLGICMGSYLAGCYYLDLLKKNTAAAQYVRRKGSTVLHEKPDVVELLWEGARETVYFFDGAAFVPRKGFKNISGEVIARYLNGDPAALIQPHKKGRVGVIGPHPEAHKWWFYIEKKIRDRWQDCVKHHLLLDFVERLL